MALPSYLPSSIALSYTPATMGSNIKTASYVSRTSGCRQFKAPGGVVGDERERGSLDVGGWYGAQTIPWRSRMPSTSCCSSWCARKDDISSKDSSRLLRKFMPTCRLRDLTFNYVHKPLVLSYCDWASTATGFHYLMSSKVRELVDIECPWMVGIWCVWKTDLGVLVWVSHLRNKER